MSTTSSVEQKQGSAVTIWAIGAFCIFGWEYLLCLSQEYKQIWRKPLNISSVLYIANRYFGLIQLSFVMTLQANIWSPGACKHVYLWETVGTVISTFLSQLIVGGRVYAIFAQNRAIAFILGFLLVIQVVVGGIYISAVMGPPCVAVVTPFGWVVAFWSIPFVYCTLVFLFTAWKAYDFRTREVDTPLFNLIWRDGLLYFFAIFCMNTANFIIFLRAPPYLKPVNLTPSLVLEIALSCRLVLNLRSFHRESASIPLYRSVPWSDNSKTQTNRSSGVIPGDQSRSKESASTQVTGKKLEPNRAYPWNAESLYTNSN